MKSMEIRKKFFDFFTTHGHTQIASSSLIPAQDPTLLFTNAGMNQFKDLFLGNEKRSYTKAVTIQKCVRAGGKHNDLDNVGFTRRHLTFFEMMGNFSFGDYFKKEAIYYAWTLLTKELGLSPDNLYVSVYEQDDEAFELWNKTMGVPAERIMRFGKKDNFWQMGNTGPCGPCTEIYVDQRPATERTKTPSYQDFDEGRLLEVWNLVFMQYDLQEDGSLVPLKQTGVDTGMGLERITCVLQGVDSVYKSDIFLPLIAATEKLTGLTYAKQDEKTKAAFHVLADHIRSSSLIIADGGSPSNEGRGYVLRKIIRRAALFAQKLTSKNIFPDLAKVFIAEMSPIYPELKTSETMIVSLLHNEIEQFAANLVRGQNILETFIKDLQDKQITGEQAFKLYDTYGFPLEVTILAAQERGYSVDAEGFEKAMEKQRQLSGKKMKEVHKDVELPADINSTFVGYEKTNVVAPIVGLLLDDAFVTTAPAGSSVWVITKECPFFVTTGGQVDDQGYALINGKQAQLEGLRKFGTQAQAFKITTPVALTLGDTVTQQVELSSRINTMNNHTATHLLQAALIGLFGKQVKQAGSVVHPDYLRFDFTYHKNLTDEEITEVETVINNKIRENITLSIFNTTYKDALDKGVIAIFGEKYNPEVVRVVDVPGFSAELCGGTHVPSTAFIGSFKITEVSSLSAGVRRIFAVTGPKAVELMQKNFTTVKTLSQSFKVKPEEVIGAVEKQEQSLSDLTTQLRATKKQLLSLQIPVWAETVTTIKSAPFLYLNLEQQSAEDLREIATQLQTKKPGIYMVVSSTEGKTSFYVTIAPDYQKTFDLTAFAAWLKTTAGLTGGGKNGILQGGGPLLDKQFGKEVQKYLEQ